MSRQIRPIARAVLSLACLAVLAVPLAAARVPASGPDSTPNTPPPSAKPADAPAPAWKFSGYAEASYAYSNQAVSDMIVGRLYDRYSNAFVLNAWKLGVDHPFDPKKLSAGGHADLLVGQNAAVTQSLGFNLGTNGDITQLYAVLNMPTSNGNGVQFKLGKMVTLMGLEVIEDVANPNWSLGNQFNFVENFTATGVELDFKPGSAVDVELRLDNGWDRITPTDGPKDFMGRIGFAGKSTTLALLGFYGAQHPTEDAARYGVEALLNQKFGKTSIWIQADYGIEAMNDSLPDPTQDAKWWAVGGWIASDLSPAVNLAIRADYVDDTNGFRTSAFLGYPASTGAEHKLWSLTGTLNIKAWSDALVRPEVRYDHSDLLPYDGKSTQVTVALSAAFLY